MTDVNAAPSERLIIDQRLRDYFLTRREGILKELGFIEDTLNLRRTMPRLERIEDIQAHIDYLQGKLAQKHRDRMRGRSG
jgi:hypothetical protein